MQEVVADMGRLHGRLIVSDRYRNIHLKKLYETDGMRIYAISNGEAFQKFIYLIGKGFLCFTSIFRNFR